MLSCKTSVKRESRNILKKIEEFLKEANSVQMRAGFVKEEKYPNGVSVASVAEKQEFGGISTDLQTIVPPRPFMRPAFEGKKDKWVSLFKDYFTNGEFLRGRGIIEKSFERLGGVVVNDIQNAIRGVFDPPLAPYTLNKREERGIVIDA